MKKSTLFFFSTLIALFILPQNAQAQYATTSECQSNCSSPFSCGYDHAFQAYMCRKSGPSSSVCPSGYYATFSYTYNNCQFALSKLRSEGRNCGSGCISYSGGYYICASNSTSSGGCPANCSSCDSSSVCTTCNSGYYLSSGSCVTCPSNATCNGSSTFTCNSGYTKSGSSCVQDKPKNTVSSCPSRMTLSSDGCCCINK